MLKWNVGEVPRRQLSRWLRILSRFSNRFFFFFQKCGQNRNQVTTQVSARKSRELVYLNYLY